MTTIPESAAKVARETAEKILGKGVCDMFPLAVNAVASALEAAGRREWRPMSEAPKDRSSVLLLTRIDVRPDREDLDRWRGIQFVGRHPGLAEDGFDIGWSVAAPVGYGGFPDDWFVGWMPLPPSPVPEGK